MAETSLSKIHKITVILPARNEESALPCVLAEINLAKTLLPNVDIQALVVDNNSSDHTAEVAKNNNATVIYCKKKGKGNAFRTALSHSLLDSSDIIIMSDADSTYPLIINIYKIAELVSERNDVVIGYRDNLKRGSMTRLNYFGNKLLSAITTLLYRFHIRDVCSGLWGFKKDTLLGFHLTSPEFTLEADLFTNAYYSHCRIAQFPISYRARIGESSAKFKPVIDWFKILRFLIQRRVKSCRPLS
jgi:dolichol-phosphate mannosyltransferase